MRATSLGEAVGEVYFYHLTRQPLEVVLPVLLERALGAGWRVAVRGDSGERMEWLDQKLWLGAEDGFLPHGRAGGEFDADQPVLLTTGAATNGAACLIVVDGAALAVDEVRAMARVCVLFDGNDPAALEHARGLWRDLAGAGCKAQYWSQQSGKWAKSAES